MFEWWSADRHACAAPGMHPDRSAMAISILVVRRFVVRRRRRAEGDLRPLRLAGVEVDRERVAGGVDVVHHVAAAVDEPRPPRPAGELEFGPPGPGHRLEGA